VTIGQYLRPTPAHLPVARFYAPGEYPALAERGRRLGLAHVEAGPLVRSSFEADRVAEYGAVAV
jgi:lipoyl synthase